ncbi:putative RNA-directed DNA polymerase [Tanacetum coccineum]
MKIITYNCCGLGSDSKQNHIRSLIRNERISAIGLQETKMAVISVSLVKSLWGNNNVDILVGSVVGLSGGTLLMWNCLIFDKCVDLNGSHFISAIRNWKGISKKVGLINIYSPQSLLDKEVLWHDLISTMRSTDAIWVLFGDFNAVRSRDERFGTNFVEKEARIFNEFMALGGLHDFALGGRRFTRFNREGTKLSKLDRFLVSSNYFDVWKYARVNVLYREVSDHCPVMLHVVRLDFGPKCFKLFDHWIGDVEFQKNAQNSWNSKIYNGSADIVLKNKLKQLKADIKTWCHSKKAEQTRKKSKIQNRLLEWDVKAEMITLTDSDYLKRDEDLMDIQLLEQIERDSLKQKSRVKWAIEGDENTKYFHSLVNKQVRRNNINGLTVNGCWKDDPIVIKSASFEYFAGRYKESNHHRPRFSSDLFLKLGTNEAGNLESEFTMDELKEAVWSCSGVKSPGPDGLNFKFIKQFWDILKFDFFNFIKHFETTCSLANGCNASFIVMVPKKDDPLEIGDYRPISLIGCAYKVDFEKAFDCINWNFLLDIMKQMGFRSKWCSWIYACLSSASISVLVNGSPTTEFKIERGVRQGDPLSPFLFLIVSEALQVMVLEACNKGIFSGLSLAENGANISLLQYADDALFFGEWSKSNATNLIHILDCYHEVSGLKVNLSKSCLYGVGVPSSEIVSLARFIKCSHDSLPFTYLGLPVGKDMKKSANWNGMIDRFSKKLSNWKANLLSIGGRLTLVKSVLENLPIYFLSLFRAPASAINKMESIRKRFFWGVNANERKIMWIRWDQMVLDKKNGGLGIGSIKAKNMSLLGKCHALWNKCIKELHGYNGGFDSSLGSRSCFGVWDNIIRCCNEMEKLDINLENLMVKKWSWRREPRGRSAGELYSLENLINRLFLDSSAADKWTWSPDATGMFTVKSLSNLIQNKLIRGGRIDVPFKWNSWVLRKVNIYAWRIAMNRLPTKDNLTRFGIQINPISCLFCGLEDETRDHCFLQCSKIKLIWFKLWSWWQSNSLHIPSLGDILSGNLPFHDDKHISKAYHVTCLSLIWIIWRWRNKLVHANETEVNSLLHEDVFSSLQRLSLLWIKNRSPKKNIAWKN